MDERRGEKRSLVAAIISRSATIRAPFKCPPLHFPPPTMAQQMRGRQQNSIVKMCTLPWHGRREEQTTLVGDTVRFPSAVHYNDVFGYGAPRATVHEDRFIVDERHLAER